MTAATRAYALPMTFFIVWALCAIIATAIGGVLRQNPVAGFALGLGYGPLGVVLAYFLEGDD